MDNKEMDSPQIKAAMDMLDMGSWEADPGKGVFVCSAIFCRLLELDAAPSYIDFYYKLIREDYRSRIIESIVSAPEDHIRQRIFPVYVKDKQIWLTIRFRKIGKQKVTGVAFRVNRKKDETYSETSHETVKNLIFKLNGITKSLFAFLQNENLDDMVNHILASLVTHFSAERAYIFAYDWKEMKQSCIYEAVSREGLEVIQTLQKMFFEPNSWWNQQILAHSPIILSDLNELPEWGYVDREVLEAQDIQSLMVVPFISQDNTVWGYAGIDVVDRQRTWTKEDFQWFSSLMQIINICFELTKMTLAKNKAEALEQLKSAFLANMSHEIRTPLNAIIGFTDLLEETEDENERKEYIQIIQRNNELLLKLVNDILDLSKIESGTFHFMKSNIKAKRLCEEIILSFKNIKIPENVALVFDHNLPDEDMYADPNRIKQVLLNFMTNSIKFTRQGSVRLGYEPVGTDRILFYVEDTGSGIPPEDIDRIFDRFVKLDNFAQGTGLGLSISKSLILQMRGSLNVTSEVNKGSRFEFIIPKWMS